MSDADLDTNTIADDARERIFKLEELTRLLVEGGNLWSDRVKTAEAENERLRGVIGILAERNPSSRAHIAAAMKKYDAERGTS